MTKLKRNVLIAVAVAGVIALGCFIAHKRWEYNLLKEIRETPPEKKARMIAHNHNFVLSHVQPGMTKQQVERAIGLPQNTDSEHVWMWASESGGWAKGKEKWLDLLEAGTMYIVFLDGKVVGMPLGVEASAAVTPSELVMDVRGCDERTAFPALSACRNLWSSS